MVQTKRGYDLHELLSALQKDIRRGKEYQAMFWAAELESFCAKTVWNLLKTIASEDIGPANPIMPLAIETLEKQYFDALEEERNPYRLFLANAVVSLCRSSKSRITDCLLNIVYREIVNEDKKLPIPDYALDLHTLRGGKMMRRGWDHFFEEGAKLENEAFENPYNERAREILKKYGKLKPEFRKKKTEAKAGNSKTKRVDENLGVFIVPEMTESVPTE